MTGEICIFNDIKYTCIENFPGVIRHIDTIVGKDIIGRHDKGFPVKQGDNVIVFGSVDISALYASKVTFAFIPDRYMIIHPVGGVGWVHDWEIKRTYA